MQKFALFPLLALLIVLALSAFAAEEKQSKKLPFDPETAKDITPAPFKGILRVYKTPETNASMPTYVVRGQECLSLGTSFGGNGVYSIIAADINKDGKPDLVYASSWGSGLHRTNIGVVEVGDKLIEHKAPDMLLFEDEDIKLLAGNGRITVSVKGRPFADIVLSSHSSGRKILALKKL